jgi:predicted RNA-binding Zn-ribbon protein involved in translation (DUF1610 family)
MVPRFPFKSRTAAAPLALPEASRTERAKAHPPFVLSVERLGARGVGRQAAMSVEPEAAMMTCANCGAVVARDEERCPSCSVPLQIVCPECGAQAPAVEDDCPTCGASLAHATEAS